MSMTPADFLAQPSDPDEDAGELEQQDLTGHLASIAASLRELVGATAQQSFTAPSSSSGLADMYAEVTAELEDLHGIRERQQELIEQVREVVKPSTSRLAEKVRAILEPSVTVEAPHDPGMDRPAVAEDGQDQPAYDADVEEWRAYARGRGYRGPDIDVANKSQIRTMLGIAHEGASS